MATVCQTPQPTTPSPPGTALLVDADLRTHCVSAAAAAGLQLHARWLRWAHGRLQAPSPAMQALLRQRVAEALQSPGSVRAVALARGGDWPLIVRMQAHGDAHGRGADPAHEGLPPLAWLDIRDPRPARLDAGLLQDLFALTPVETEVAIALSDGATPAELARTRGVQPNTVNAHIKKLLHKTGTQRQGQLVALLLRACAPHQEPAALPPGAPAVAGALPDQAMACNERAS